MSNLFEQDAQPQAQYKPIPSVEDWKRLRPNMTAKQRYDYAICPGCQDLMTYHCRLCRQCLIAEKRAAVTQPDDPTIRHIPLTQGKYAIVNVGDYDWLMQWEWCASYNPTTGFYAMRKIVGTSAPIWMHYLIMGIKGVDHKNVNGLDNRRDNLRPANGSEQGYNKKIYKRNTSGYKGVHLVTRRVASGSRTPWTSYVNARNVRFHLGYFCTALEANIARIEKAKELHGEFYRER